MTIARHEGTNDKRDVWAELAAPLPKEAISWRQDGRAVQRDGKFMARFVCYIEANTVRERLDGVLPGEWDLTLELLPTIAADADGEEVVCSFKARLQALGVIREDVGTGRDYKSAATDAFKRAGVRFGIGHELYSYEQNWVQVDGDGKFAKPVEDPSAAYARRHGGGTPRATPTATVDSLKKYDPKPIPIEERAPRDNPLEIAEPSCPKCGGKMWDNRLSKKNPKQPDFKCRDTACDGVIWPPKAPATKSATKPVAMPKQLAAKSDDDAWADAVARTDAEGEGLPF